MTTIHERAMPPTNAAELKLVLTEEERQELLRVLEGCLSETHAERRRTDKPKYQDQVAHEEKLLHDLLSKVRQAS